MVVQKDLHATAIFSDDMKYRYYLERIWDNKKHAIAFIMLNPSTATEEVMDPTVKRCYNFAHDWGYGSLIVGNLFALRATNPKELYKSEDPVGGENDKYIQMIHKTTAKTILAWGEHGNYKDRGAHVYTLIKQLNGGAWHSPYCLKTTSTGQPMHPLYIKMDTLPKEYSPPKSIQEYNGNIN